MQEEEKVGVALNEIDEEQSFETANEEEAKELKKKREEKGKMSASDMIHRILKDKYEYVFLTNEGGTKEIGCFLVYFSFHSPKEV